MVAFVTISNANGFDVTIPQVLMVTIPACVCGLMCAAAASYHRGLDLDKDPVFQKRLQDPAQREYIYGGTATTLDKKISKESRRAVYIFFGALAVIVMFAVFQNLLPAYDSVKAIDGAKDVTLASGVTVTPKELAAANVVLPGVTVASTVKLKMNLVIQIVMISAAALMIMFCKASPKKAVAGAVWQSGRVVWWLSMVSRGWPIHTSAIILTR